MLSKELEVTLNQAFQHARELKHEYLTVEHLLSALLDNVDAKYAVLQEITQSIFWMIVSVP